ncbi:class I SAM-dependent methyltransferase [Catenulispora subtropica]|uniref:Class I SAM-dependent methyltransferase n=1 Tax=Catenulispora subtropica TaxID=450798 RepID=A0ABP5EHR7_9ACTN
MGGTDAWARRQAAQAGGFDAIGGRYDEAFPHKEGQIACVERLLADLPDGARVLDAGAGTGLPAARRLLDAGCAVTCVDFSPVMLELARANVPEAAFVFGDLADLPEDPARYEAVTAFFSLLMLPRARIGTVLRSFHRTLTPGGLLAVAMVEADVDDMPIPFLGNWLRVTGYSREAWRGVLEEAGFAVEWEDTLTYVPEQAVMPEVQMFALCRRLPV